MSFLGIGGRKFLITGVSNKKSVACHTAKIIEEQGGECLFTVQHQKAKEFVHKTFPASPVFLLDVEYEDQVASLGKELSAVRLDGLLHSMAFGNLVPDRPFHAVSWEDYSQAEKISGFSLMVLANALKSSFEDEASVVTISISDTRATSYGYLGPIKASLESKVAFLAKSFSAFSKVRFNAVQSAPLKTSASAGIPGYIDHYLFAEKLILRKSAIQTQEVARAATFLLSPASSGINAACVLVDGGMRCNYFDESVVKAISQNL